MIKLIHGSQRQEYPDLIEQMFRLRARVFHDRLDWDVVIDERGREIDRFDDLDPLYVLSLSPTGEVVGSLRALQTTGPNMLAEVFSVLLPDEMTIRSPLIWESTRFCVDTDRAEQISGNGLRDITGELLCGLFEVGLAVGLSHIVSVFDARMERVLKRAGCHHERIGAARRIGEVMTMAALFEVSEAMVERLHATNAIAHPAVSSAEFQRIGVAA